MTAPADLRAARADFVVELFYRDSAEPQVFPMLNVLAEQALGEVVRLLRWSDGAALALVGATRPAVALWEVTLTPGGGYEVRQRCQS